MGVQQLNDELIKYSGRRQTREQVFNALELCHKYDLANSLDLIYGWPEQTMANMLEDGQTPWALPEELEQIGYSLVAYPLSLQLSGFAAMTDAALALREGAQPPGRARFEALQEIVGVPAYRSRLEG